MIEVNERVDVAASPQVVWDLLSNPHAVVNCVNGAKLGDQHGLIETVLGAGYKLVAPGTPDA